MACDHDPEHCPPTEGAGVTVHDPTDTCTKVHCYGCGQDHPQQRAWLWCFECGHAYRTPGELRRAYRRVLLASIRHERLPWLRGNEFDPSKLRILWQAVTIRASKIYFCQLCLHDF